jgi:pimeloyl-ACP methyl ester carboxylesterase
MRLLALLGFGLLLLTESARAETAPLDFKSCRLEQPLRLASYAAECATLRVAEDAARPNGRKISLRIARIPAVSRRKQPDPLFLVAGGPGMGTALMYTNSAAAFARIRRDRDIILLDQRGTGESAALNCEFGESETVNANLERLVELTNQCRDELAKRADLRFYTTSVAVRDLDLVRRALGVAQINLYGVSYGSRVAQHYLRRYPSQTRSLILDGVVAPDAVLPEGIALDAEAALSQVLARCRADLQCQKTFGDPATHYRKVLARVSQEPVKVTVADPRSGELREQRFDRLNLAAVLRLQIYSPLSASTLPLALWQAAERNDFRALAGQSLLIDRSLRNLMAVGMHNSVMCAEDDPRLDGRAVDRVRLEATFLGALQLDGIRRICAAWPRGPVDRDLFDPVQSAVPVLLLSGGADPVTPPSYATQAMQKLGNARHLELPGMGHGQLGAPCMDRVMADFLRDRRPKTLDASCLQRLKPAPFMLTPAGPAP